VKYKYKYVNVNVKKTYQFKTHCKDYTWWYHSTKTSK